MKLIKFLQKQFDSSYRLIVSFLLSLLVMFFYSECSPEYYTNTYIDTNAFMTVGKSILFGKVPYKDLFEQKGPVLYFIYALGYLISPGRFWGIFLFEVLMMTVNMVLAYKITKLYLKEPLAFLISLLTPAYLMTYWFATGGFAEEFVIPLIFTLVYFVLKSDRRAEPGQAPNLSWWELTLLAAFFALAFWIKYTTVGAWLAFYLIFTLFYLFKRKWLLLGKSILFSLLGFGLVTGPILLYFWLHQALYYLFNVYFTINMTAYSVVASPLGDLIHALAYVFSDYNSHLFVFAFTLLGILAFSCTSFFVKNVAFRVVVFLAWLSNGLLSVYSSLNHWYTPMIFTPFTVLGVCTLAYFLARFKAVNFKSPLNILIVFVLGFALPLLTNANYNLSRLFPANQNNLAQLAFAKIIDSKKNSTLLEYGYLDSGEYLSANKVPITRFFEEQYIDPKRYPDIVNGQNAVIRDQKVDFVVTWVSPFFDRADYTLLKKNYKQVENLDGQILWEKN